MRLKSWIKSAICLSICMGVNAYAQNRSVLENFITARGDRIFDGEKPFRFISCNIPNLLTVEDNMAFTATGAWRLPDQFEIEDALQTIKEMGGRVTRTYVITVRRESDSQDTPKFVEGPGRFNEEAFGVMDRVLATANRIGIRLIIPIVDNWKWMGGKPQYAAFRNKPEAEFWTDAEIRNDYKNTVAFLLNRINTVTGTVYKEDKAILAWELGNEIHGAPVEWISEMAGFIKSIDRNHLVSDGRQSGTIDDDLLDIKDVDILSTHHYEQNPDDMRDHIRESRQKAKGKKPYYIGEYGFISTTAIETILKEIEQDPVISGAMIWSLRFHNRDGGFYWHSEPAGGGLYKAYHWPGFSSGREYDEKNLLTLIRGQAFGIAGEPEPDADIPEPPVLLPFDDVAAISWQGSAGADHYIVERSGTGKDSWQIIAGDISDAAGAYRPLFNDISAAAGASYYYRVKAANAAGSSKPSNVTGPVKVQYKTLVDEMENFAVLYFREGPVSLETASARMFKEDFHRLKGAEGAGIVYRTPGPIRNLKVYTFSSGQDQVPAVSVSEDGRHFLPVETTVTNFFAGRQDYAYLHPLLVTADTRGRKARYIRLEFKNESQLGRVEVTYDQ